MNLDQIPYDLSAVSLGESCKRLYQPWSVSMVIWIQASQGSNMDQVPTLFLLALLSALLIKLYPSPRTRVRDDCAFNDVILDRHNWARRWITVFFQLSLFILVIFKANPVRKIPD